MHRQFFYSMRYFVICFWRVRYTISNLKNATIHDVRLFVFLLELMLGVEWHPTFFNLRYSASSEHKKESKMSHGLEIVVTHIGFLLHCFYALRNEVLRQTYLCDLNSGYPFSRWYKAIKITHTSFSKNILFSGDFFVQKYENFVYPWCVCFNFE